MHQQSLSRLSPVQRWLKNASKSIRKYWQLYLLVLPAVIYLWLFNYVPMYGVQIAFRNFSARKGILGSPWVVQAVRFVPESCPGLCKQS